MTKRLQNALAKFGKLCIIYLIQYGVVYPRGAPRRIAGGTEIVKPPQKTGFIDVFLDGHCDKMSPQAGKGTRHPRFSNAARAGKKVPRKDYVN